MNSMTEGKILRAIFGKQGPTVVCRSTDDKKKCLATFEEGLKDLASIRLESGRSYTHKVKGPELGFSVESPQVYGPRYCTLIIEFTEEDVLCLKKDYEGTRFYLCGEIQQIAALADRYRAEEEILKKRQIKAKKVKELKTAAIIARIREVAMEYEFDYHYEIKTTKVKLVALIEESSFLEVDIPFGQFQARLQGIRDCIRLAREIGALKVVKNIKFQGVERYEWNWISYKKAEDSESE